MASTATNMAPEPDPRQSRLWELALEEQRLPGQV